MNDVILEKVIQSIQNDLDEAKESFSDCENEIDKSFQQGRIFAHNYDLFVIERILKEVKHGEWVSCDERLPEEKGEYLVTYHPCYWDNVDKEVMVGIDTFRGKTKWAKSKYQRVIAWMPKPNPYVERRETE